MSIRTLETALESTVIQIDSAAWKCDRVELNAMTSPQFIEWLEEKLKRHRVEKVIL